MLRKLLSGQRDTAVVRHIPAVELERALAGLCLEPPHAVWAALVTETGDLRACFPSAPAVQKMRLAAMSVALSSLGERISRELSIGALGYTLISGVEGAVLMIALDDDYLLALGLPPACSLDAVFEGVRLLAVPLLQLLGLADLAI